MLPDWLTSATAREVAGMIASVFLILIMASFAAGAFLAANAERLTRYTVDRDERVTPIKSKRRAS